MRTINNPVASSSTRRAAAVADPEDRAGGGGEWVWVLCPQRRCRGAPAWDLKAKPPEAKVLMHSV